MGHPRSRPQYRSPADAPVLAAAYISSLARADEVSATSVAFPCISTGIYGYPADAAAEVSVDAILAAHTRVELVLLVSPGRHMADLWTAVLESRNFLRAPDRSSETT